MKVVLFRTSGLSDELFTKIIRRLKQSTKIGVDVCEKPYPFKGVDPHDRVNVDKLHEAIKETRLNEDEGIKIVYTDQDIYSPGLDYVFGKAYAGDRICIVSSRRLQDVRDMDRTVERLVKVTLHEIGHLLRLTHCEDPGCVMYRSNDAVSVDGRALSFCERCAQNFGFSDIYVG
jgi:predicted Zn-dependent protease